MPLKLEFLNQEAGVENGWPDENHIIEIEAGMSRPFAQLTYEGLRVGPDGDHVAYFLDDAWVLNDGTNRHYSDVVIMYDR